MQFEQLFTETLELIGMGEEGIAVGIDKARILHALTYYARTISGEVAEVGSWLGGSARIIAKQLNDRPMYVMDTFEGIPEVDERYEPGDWLGQFHHGDPYETACRILKDCPNVQIFKGMFPQSILGYFDEHTFAFVHADADVYPSTKDICEFFYHRLAVGGILIFDDYGYEKASGCRKAVDDFFADKKESPSILTTGQAIVIKSYEGSFGGE